jgi:hypothetical protein
MLMHLVFNIRNNDLKLRRLFSRDPEPFLSLCFVPRCIDMGLVQKDSVSEG